MSGAPKSVFVTLGGGLGDVFYTYNKRKNGWGYIESLKKKYPNTEVRAMCATHNPQTLEFIKYNPYIDRAEEFGWVLDAKELWDANKGNSVRLDRQRDLLKKLRDNKPQVYLSPEDKVILDGITSSGEFVLMHPFAGEPHRRVMPAEEYIPLIDRIIDELGYNVVVIGGSYLRTNRIQKEVKTEELDYKREGLFNLVGQSNSRICMTLAEKQRCFVGSWSAYSCASWLYNKQTTVLLQKKHIENLKKKIGRGKRWGEAKCDMITTKGPYHNPGDTNFNKVREEAFNKIQNETK